MHNVNGAALGNDSQPPAASLMYLVFFATAVIVLHKLHVTWSHLNSNISNAMCGKILVVGWSFENSANVITPFHLQCNLLRGNWQLDVSSEMAK